MRSMHVGLFSPFFFFIVEEVLEVKLSTDKPAGEERPVGYGETEHPYIEHANLVPGKLRSSAKLRKLK